MGVTADLPCGMCCHDGAVRHASWLWTCPPSAEDRHVKAWSRGGRLGYLRKCCCLDMRCSLLVARLRASTWMNCCCALLCEP